MTVEILGYNVQLSPFEGAPKPDLFGRSPARASIQTTASSELDDAISDRLEAGRSTEPLVGSDGREWIVDNWSSSYRNNSNRVTWNIDLTELVKSELTSVEFGGLDLSVRWVDLPDAYRPGTRATVTVEVSSDQAMSDEIFRLIAESGADYFPVKFHGLSSDPIPMRFGRYVWARSGDELVHSITFVTQDGDEDDPRGLTINQPELTRTTEMSARSERMIAALLDKLESAGVLSREMIDEIGAIAGDDLTPAQSRELFRANHIEDFR